MSPLPIVGCMMSKKKIYDFLHIAVVALSPLCFAASADKAPMYPGHQTGLQVSQF